MNKITSINNLEIKRILKLTEKDELFLLEGFHLVDEALSQNIVEKIFILEEFVDKYNNFKNIILINEKILNKLSDVKNPQGVIALCYKKKYYKSKENKILLLDSINDPGNLGTIIRSAVAFNFAKIITSENSVSLYNKKVLRSTQGAFFYIDYEKNNLKLCLKKYKKENYYIIGTYLKENSKKINNLNNHNKIVLLLGSEANGINYDYLKYIDENIIIKTTNKIESLNLSVAASILMYKINKN